METISNIIKPNKQNTQYNIIITQKHIETPATTTTQIKTTSYTKTNKHTNNNNKQHNNTIHNNTQQQQKHYKPIKQQ